MLETDWDGEAIRREALVFRQSKRRERVHCHARALIPGHRLSAKCEEEPPIMRKLPPPHPRGMARTAGSGRKRGTPNRKTVELRVLMGAMAGDIDYQRKLTHDFRKRRLHPSTEIKIWEYALGRPKEQLELSANVTMNEQMEAERKMLRQLDLKQLEALAAESQALMDRAFAAALAKPGIPDTIDVPAPLTVSPREAAYTKDDENGGGEAVTALLDPKVDPETGRRHDQ